MYLLSKVHIFKDSKNVNWYDWANGNSHQGNYISNSWDLNDISEVVLAHIFDTTCNWIFFSFMHVWPVSDFESGFCSILYRLKFIVAIDLSDHVFPVIRMAINSLFMHVLHFDKVIRVNISSDYGWAVPDARLSEWAFARNTHKVIIVISLTCIL